MCYREEEWATCQRCELHKSRVQVVQYTGSPPADVLFVGEAPGRSEDCWGEPFCGPAGDYLKRIIELVKDEHSFTYCVTNVICCIPKDENGDVRIPKEKELEACSERFIEFLNWCNPKLVVLLGKVCQKHWDNLLKSYDIDVETCQVQHPSYILRSPRESHAWRQHDAAATIITALDLIPQE